VDVTLLGRMSCVLVQHRVKMSRITDASDRKTRGRRFPPRHQTSPFQHSATHEHPIGTTKHHLKCITLWHVSLAEAVLFYDILPDLSANNNN